MRPLDALRKYAATLRQPPIPEVEAAVQKLLDTARDFIDIKASIADNSQRAIDKWNAKVDGGTAIKGAKTYKGHACLVVPSIVTNPRMRRIAGFFKPVEAAKRCKDAYVELQKVKEKHGLSEEAFIERYEYLLPDDSMDAFIEASALWQKNLEEPDPWDKVPSKAAKT